MVETLAGAAETIEAPPSDPASWPTLENVSPAAPASEVASNPFAAPTGPIRVGHYVLLSEVGRGGMGVVHAAYDERLDRKVALKVLRTQGDSWAQRRLVREAQGLARLSHPNVVQIYEIGEVGGHTFLAMEFIDGVTLRRWCSEQPRTRAEILATFLAAGRGLAAAHAKSLIHREHKPAPCIPASQPDAPSISKDLAGLQGAGLPRVAPRCPTLPRSAAKIWQRIGPLQPATWRAQRTPATWDRPAPTPAPWARPASIPATWARPASTPTSWASSLDTHELGELSLDPRLGRAWPGLNSRHPSEPGPASTLDTRASPAQPRHSTPNPGEPRVAHPWPRKRARPDQVNQQLEVNDLNWSVLSLGEFAQEHISMASAAVCFVAKKGRWFLVGQGQRFGNHFKILLQMLMVCKLAGGEIFRDSVSWTKRVPRGLQVNVLNTDIFKSLAKGLLSKFGSVTPSPLSYIDECFYSGEAQTFTEGADPPSLVSNVIYFHVHPSRLS